MAITGTPNIVITTITPGVETKPSWGLFVEWADDATPFTDEIDNITKDFTGGTFKRGRTASLGNTEGGSFDFEVNDFDGDYAPDNASSRFGSGNIQPGKRVKLKANLDGVVYEMFTGRMEQIDPHNLVTDQFASISCVDGFQSLARNNISAPQDSKSNFANSPLINARSGDQGVTKVSGVNLTFADANPDTIVRASGSFVTDGYVAGMQVKVKDSILNDSIYTLATVVALTLTLQSGDILAAEGPSSGITIERAGIIGEILDSQGWPVADRNIDPGVDNFDLWWILRQSPLNGIYEIEDQEFSMGYVEGDGIFHWEDRHHKLRGSSNPHRTSQATFDDTMQDMRYTLSSASIINKVTIRGHKRVVKASDQVYGTQDRPKIGAGETIVLFADLSDPTTQVSIDTSGDGTDWKANTERDGTGIDKTSDVTLVVNHFGQTTEFILNNGGSVPVFLIPGTSDADDTLYMTGLAYDDDPIVVIDSDATSIAKRDPFSHSIDMTYKGDANNLRALAAWVIQRFKDPTPTFVEMPVQAISNAQLVNMLKLKISDRITCTFTPGGITSQDYFIRHMAHTIEENEELSTVYLLEKVDALEAAYWVLGVATLGELGLTTTLGI